MQSGGCVGVAKPLGTGHGYHSSQYERLVKALRLHELPIERRMGELRKAPWQNLVEIMVKIENPDGMFCITADQDLVGGFWKVPNATDIGKSLLIGNTCHDVSPRPSALLTHRATHSMTLLNGKESRNASL